MTRQLTQLHVALMSDFQKSDLSVFESFFFLVKHEICSTGKQLNPDRTLYQSSVAATLYTPGGRVGGCTIELGGESIVGDK